MFYIFRLVGYASSASNYTPHCVLEYINKYRVLEMVALQLISAFISSCIDSRIWNECNKRISGSSWTVYVMQYSDILLLQLRYIWSQIHMIYLSILFAIASMTLGNHLVGSGSERRKLWPWRIWVKLNINEPQRNVVKIMCKYFLEHCYYFFFGIIHSWWFVLNVVLIKQAVLLKCFVYQSNFLVSKSKLLDCSLNTCT